MIIIFIFCFLTLCVTKKKEPWEEDPICLRGGGKCICPWRWEDTDPAIEPGCVQKDCGNGTLNQTNNECQCLGWNGQLCDVCVNDTMCQLEFNTSEHSSYCVKTLSSYKNFNVFCDIVDPFMANTIGNFTTMQCKNVGYGVTGYGECYFQSWMIRVSGVKEELMWCELHQCKYYREKRIRYSCLHSVCSCAVGPYSSSACDIWVGGVLATMTGKGTVFCDEEGECEFYHEQFGSSFIMQCESSECVDEIVPPPEYNEEYVLYTSIGFIGGFIIVVFIIFIVFFIIDRVFRKKTVKEQKLLEEFKESGGRVGELQIRRCWQTTEKEHILKGTSFTCKPGRLVAITGSTGAGKTTLLDILAGRTKIGKMTGEILFNNKPPDNTFRRLVGYVLQDDVLINVLTVRECVKFSADLRIATSVPSKKKSLLVQNILEELKITGIAKKKIGDEMTRGISGGERKRVSIAAELVKNPHVLFLDEPTTGLDSSTAYTIIKYLSELAKRDGILVVFSIHQPRERIFKLFDDIIILSKGKEVYAGPTDGVIEFFSKMGYEFKGDMNPADWIQDVVTDMENIEDGDNELKFLYKRKEPKQKNGILKVQNTGDQFENEKSSNDGDKLSPTDASKAEWKEKPNVIVEEKIESKKEEQTSKVIPIEGDPCNVWNGKLTKYATPFFHQLWTLIVRDFKIFIRNFYLMPAHFLSAILVGIVLAIFYYDSEYNFSGSQNRFGFIFMCCVFAFTAMSGIGIFIKEKPVYVRERANAYYYPINYFFSKLILDLIPLRVIPPIIMILISYFLIGQRIDPFYHFFVFVGLIILFNVISGGLCITIGSLMPSASSANLVATVFSGFLLNSNSLPSYISWCRYLSYWSYSYESLMINEFENSRVLLDPDESISVDVNGEFILNTFGMNAENYTVNLVMMSFFACFFIVLSGLILQFVVKEKR